MTRSSSWRLLPLLLVAGGCGPTQGPAPGNNPPDQGMSPPGNHDQGMPPVADPDLGVPPGGDPDLGAPPDALAPTSGLFAAPDGTGSACTLSAPCSLTGAQSAARALAASADVVVNLRGGTYRLTTPWTFDGSDSGKPGHPVVYRAYASETPILTGAQSVTGFTLVDPAAHLWRATVPTGTVSRQLFVGGVRAERPHTQRGSMAFTPTARGLATVAAITTPQQWALRPGMEAAMDNAWKHMRCAITGIEPTGSATALPGHTAPAAGGSLLVIEPGCWANNETAVVQPGYPFNGGGVPPSLDGVSTIENVYELLGANGASGQFYLDTANRYLYYVPRIGEDPASAAFELPLLTSVLTVSGAPGHLAPLNDNDGGAASYSADWVSYGGRGFGDWSDDVHATQGTGAARLSFTGTGVDVLGELEPGHGSFTATVVNDNGATVASGNGTETAAVRLAQQVIYSVANLPPAHYTVIIQKSASDGTWLTLDGLVVTGAPITPVHDLAFRGITFTGTTWLGPSQDGYIDNQAGILWDPISHLPTRVPGAVRVQRGQRIEVSGNRFVHLGGAGLELADGTQDSTIIGNRFDDLSAGAISVGEVDDYYLGDTLATGAARMTSGIQIADNSVTNTGIDYHDTVSIWVGNSRRTTVAHNLVAHASYTGISVGWGWGWVAPCDRQMAARPGEPCRRGTNYNGGNQILGNRIYDVMRTLIDGGPIYTLGEQSVLGGITPTTSGNVVSNALSCFHMIYHDEGSSYWQTHGNVVYNTGCHWLGIWIPTAHDINAGGIGPNYSDNPQAASDDGTADVIHVPTLLPLGVGPAASEAIIAASGLEPAYRALTPTTKTLNDGDAAFRYSSDASAPQWGALAFRGFGDLQDDVHYATANGATAWLGFTGTGVDILGERDVSQGMIEIYVDGVSQGMANTGLAAGALRQVQQPIASVHGLTSGAHTVAIVKRSGSYATIDGARFDQPVAETTASP